jgi:hypothetical protein
MKEAPHAPPLGQKIIRPMETGAGPVVAEYDPWIIAQSLDGGRVTLMLQTLRDKTWQWLVWPGDSGKQSGLTNFDDDALNERIVHQVHANIAQAKELPLVPFPSGDRIAVIGRGPTADDWHKGEPLTGLEPDAHAWEPNLAIYCNQAGERVRPLPGKNAKNWLCVVDFRCDAKSMAKALEGKDGLIASVAVPPDLIPYAIERGLDVHVLCPPNLRELWGDVIPGMGRVTFVTHQHGVGCTLLGAIGMYRQQGSVLVTGLDGLSEFPADDETFAEAIKQWQVYQDMACANAGMVFYLYGLGLRVHVLSSKLGDVMTPFGHATAALMKWKMGKDDAHAHRHMLALARKKFQEREAGKQ